MLVDLKNGHEKTQEFPALKAILMGDKKWNKRAQVRETMALQPAVVMPPTCPHLGPSLSSFVTLLKVILYRVYIQRYFLTDCPLLRGLSSLGVCPLSEIPI